MPHSDAKAGDDLTDTDIALLCDIGEFAPDEKRPERRARMAGLIARGYVRCSHDDIAALGATFTLTRKAQDMLSARGASLNEA